MELTVKTKSGDRIITTQDGELYIDGQLYVVPAVSAVEVLAEKANVEAMPIDVKTEVQLETTDIVLKITHQNGLFESTLNGLRHSFDDQPAYISKASQSWYQHGKYHRDDDLPAVIYTTGSQEWYQHGEHHRDGDEPAIINYNGNKFWYQRGKYHREGDKPAAVDWVGNQFWYQHDKLHRDGDEPAIIYTTGGKEWYKQGILHRDNGAPAIIEFKDGKLHNYQYWINGKKVGEVLM